VACHGEDGEAGHVGPPITPGLPIGQVVRIIADGRNEMPSFTGSLSSFEARDIARGISPAM
jgi:mono/diheme cytochrome c family protein